MTFSMKILFIHMNFPGQYKHVVASLGANPEHQVAFITANKKTPDIPGIKRISLDIPTANPASRQCHPYLQFFDIDIQHGEQFFGAFQELKKTGFYPDVIAVHASWGVGLFIKDAFPDVPVLAYQEFFQSPEWDFVNSEPPRRHTIEESKNWRINAARSLSHLAWADWNITPTIWQRNTFPDIYHPRISVLHEGVDCELLNPAKIPLMSLLLPDGTKIPGNAELVTFVARSHEPTRGFLTVMRAIETIQKKRKETHFLLLGTEDVNYSKRPPGTGSWRAQMLSELDLDMRYIHMPGNMNYRFYLGLLRASNVHYYFTTGFVLSWSCLEAMAMGCLVIGSATPPVQEVITHGDNGLLVDFNDADTLAEQTIRALDESKSMKALRTQARSTIVGNYSIDQVLPMQELLLMDLAKSEIPPPAAMKINEWRSKHGLSI